LMEMADGRSLGHANWRLAILSIPEKVAERQHFDRMTFPVNCDSPILFSWLWKRR